MLDTFIASCQWMIRLNSAKIKKRKKEIPPLRNTALRVTGPHTKIESILYMCECNCFLQLQWWCCSVLPPTGASLGCWPVEPSAPRSAAAPQQPAPARPAYPEPEAHRKSDRKSGARRKWGGEGMKGEECAKHKSRDPYQQVHMLQLPAQLLHSLSLHLDHKNQRLLLRLPECTWTAVGLQGEWWDVSIQVMGQLILDGSCVQQLSPAPSLPTCRFLCRSLWNDDCCTFFCSSW